MVPWLWLQGCSGSDKTTLEESPPPAVDDGPQDTEPPEYEETSHTCFAGDALVATPDGERAIASLRTGDAVSVVDLRTRSLSSARLTGPTGTGVGAAWIELVAGGRTLRLTPGHELFDPSRGIWAPVRSLRTGGILVGPRGEPVTITARRLVELRAPTFDLRLPSAASVVVAGVVAAPRMAAPAVSAPGWRFAVAGAGLVAASTASATGGWHPGC